MKRSVILTLCIMLCLALTLGGTIAYLSNTDGDVNVMTLGQVKIDVEEFQRDGDGFRGYEDGLYLYPQVEKEVDLDEHGLPIDPTFHDKIVRVRSNARNANAYLRIWIGVPTAMLHVGADQGLASPQEAVHLILGDNVRLGDESNSGGSWVQGKEVQTEIDNVPYTMFCYNYSKLLTPNEVTIPVLAGLYLDKRVDNSDNPADGYTMWIDGVEYPIDCDLSKGLQVTVLAQAVQADGFDTAEMAFAEAGMDDPKVFDEELDLVTPVEEFTEQVQSLLDSLVDALQNPGGEMREMFEQMLADLKAWMDQGEITEEEYNAKRAALIAEMEIVLAEAPYEVNLQSTTYDMNGAAAGALSALASTVDSQKQIRLLVKEGSEVTFNFDDDAELPENLVLANDGGTLTINGPEN